MSDADVTPEQREALDIARNLIEHGVPVFSAPPCPAANGGTCERKGHTGQQEYDLPPKWQLTVPSMTHLERWRPGWALGAVGGHTADFLDEDPRNGGSTSVAELKAAGQWPRLFGIQQSASGGFHYIISAIGEREANGFMPGLDYQGGAPDGQGRAFVWIAPTVRRSKAAENAGQRCTYRWLEVPDLDYLDEFRIEGQAGNSDDSIEGLRDRLIAARTKSKSTAPDERTAREFTEEQARQFCDITVQRLMQAEIGQIEEAANAAAAQLSHFVPDFWSEEFAYSVLMAALGETAYDPDHPASGWTAEKFRDVLAGVNGRAPSDWKAVRKAETPQEAAAQVEPDAVDALLAEMMTPAQIENIPAPRHLIRGVLTLDSEAWMVGGPGSKKSFTALDMAACISLGRPWQGLETMQGPSVIIVAEGASGTGKRVKAWQKSYGQMGPVYFLPRPVQAANLGAWATLVKACQRIAPVFVVIDTQARVTVGLEENSAKDMGVFVDAVSAIRHATGACVMAVHHTGRRGQDARGSSALDGAQSTELTIVPDGQRSLTGKMKITKQKDLDERGDVPLRFKVIDLGVNEFGEPINSLVLTQPDAWREHETDAASFDPASSVQVREPLSWTQKYVTREGAQFLVQRQILQTLADLAGQEGRTEGSVRAAVNERWYADRPAKDGRGRNGVDKQTWDRSWTAVMKLVDSDIGEPVVVAGSSPARKIINPELDVTDE